MELRFDRKRKEKNAFADELKGLSVYYENNLAKLISDDWRKEHHKERRKRPRIKFDRNGEGLEDVA